MLKPRVQNYETHTIVEQYAVQVLDVSSQYGSDNSFTYVARNCLGLPSRFPSYGDFSSTFAMKEYGRWWRKDEPDHDVHSELKFDNFIDFKFEHEVYVYAVYIYETFNPGAVTAVFAGNCHGKWSCLWKGPIQKVGHQPRIFSPPIDLPDFAVNQIRLIFNQRHLPYFTEIDAVALLGTLEPATTEARLLNSVDPENMGPILKIVIKRNMHRCLTDFNETWDNLCTDLVAAGEECTRRNQGSPENLPLPSSGPFTLLPREVIFKIFSYLDFSSLVQCNAVSKIFRSIASDSMLYKKVKLRSLFYCVTNETMKFLCKRATHLQELDLSWCGTYGNISPNVLKSFLIMRGGTLTSLDVSNCHVFTPNVLSSMVTCCPNLESLSLANCTLLLSSSFNCNFHQMTKLKKLNLYRTNIATAILCNILERCPLLEDLNIGSCHQINGDSVTSCLAKFNTDINTLDMWRVKRLTPRGVVTLTSCKKLRDLDLGWCCSVDANSGCLVALISACKNLVRLNVPALREINDRDVNAIKEHLAPGLEQLNIMGTRNVSQEAISSLALELKSIQLLDIGYCAQLENQDFLKSLKNILPKDCHVLTSYNQDEM